MNHTQLQSFRVEIDGTRYNLAQCSLSNKGTVDLISSFEFGCYDQVVNRSVHVFIYLTIIISVCRATACGYQKTIDVKFLDT